MANNTVSNFTIYDEYYQTAQLEVLAQNLNAFNAASQGALVMNNAAIPGNFVYSTMFDLADTVEFRDNTSTSTLSDGYLTDTEKVDVKVNMRYKPIKMTVDAFQKKGLTAETFSSLLGVTNATRKMQGLLSVSSAILGQKLSSVSGVTTDVSSASASTLTADVLARGLSKFGDQASNIVCWLMHSKPYFDLVRSAISEKIYEEAGMVVYGGSPGTLGKPVVITDAMAFNEAESSGDTTTYITLGLMPGALTVTQSEPDLVVSDLVTGEANLAYRIQGEFAVNFGVRGCTWDVTHGGTNPNLASLVTAAYWDAMYADVKSLPGVAIVTT